MNCDRDLVWNTGKIIWFTEVNITSNLQLKFSMLKSAYFSECLTDLTPTSPVKHFGDFSVKVILGIKVQNSVLSKLF